MKIIAEIPARYGSKRVKNKNLKLLNGKPLISYVIEAAKNATKIDRIFINSESDEIGKIADEYDIDFYKRSAELAEDHIVSDQFNYDFLRNTDCDVLVMINPVSPLITGNDIDEAIDYYFTNQLDTLISIREEKFQAFFQDKPINFNINELLPMTQNLLPIQICSWAINIWNKNIFLKHYEEKGHAVFSGKVGFFPLDRIKSLKISEPIDFKMAELVLKSMKIAEK
jgi:CMP-N-acetylneuraminic acid synthetase